MEEIQIELAKSSEIESIRAELNRSGASRTRRVVEKFVMAALGSIPWVGGFIAAAAELPGDEKANRNDDLRTKWLEEHHAKLDELRQSIELINRRFEELGEGIDDRIQSPEYLALVRQAFKVWDDAATSEKRRFIANVLVNCAGTRVCSDDIIRLFLDWINHYHEAHFAVIREIHQNPASTRFDIWSGVYGATPREDSAEADLYKMLIRDLSTGGVIRQARDTNEIGQYKRKRPAPRRVSAPPVMESAFEDTKPYVLTELGKQFVHYTMNEAVTRLDGVKP